MVLQSCRRCQMLSPTIAFPTGVTWLALRAQHVLTTDPGGAGALALQPARREDVLDRLACQTAICPETADVHRRARAARLALGAAAVVSAAALAAGAAVGLDRSALLRCGLCGG